MPPRRNARPRPTAAAALLAASPLEELAVAAALPNPRAPRRRFTAADARKVAASLRVRLAPRRGPRAFTAADLARGMREEYEEHRDVTGGDPGLTARIALAHLRKRPDYYDPRRPPCPPCERPRKRARANPAALDLRVAGASRWHAALDVADQLHVDGGRHVWTGVRLLVGRARGGAADVFVQPSYWWEDDFGDMVWGPAERAGVEVPWPRLHARYDARTGDLRAAPGYERALARYDRAQLAEHVRAALARVSA